MRVSVSEEMKEWVADYIRSHRREGTISIHTVFSKFNEDFKATFKMDPIVAVNLMVKEGFLKKSPAHKGVSIWLPEDEGKGKRRPFRPRKPEVNGTAISTTENQPTPSADQNGEPEMTKAKTKTQEDITIEPHYNFEKVPHPETDEVDVLELIRYIMKHIDTKLPAKPEMDGGYAVVKVNVGAALRECGLSSGAVPGLNAIMQNMGLLKHVSRDTWRVLHTKAVNYFITAQAYLLAREQWLKYAARNKEITNLRNAVADLQKQLQEFEGYATTSETKTNLPPLFDRETVAILAEAKRLNEELKKAQTHIAELNAERDQLQRELAERSTSVDAARQVLREELAAIQGAKHP